MLSLKQVFSSLWHQYVQSPRQQKKKLFKIKEALQLVQSIHPMSIDSENKQLLIVRVDDIGDYLLFRNALQVIRTSDKFKDYRITLLGNEAWKEISNHFDQTFVDDFIWLNKHSFFNDLDYQKKFLTALKDKPFETAIFPSRTRYFLLEDIIAMAVNSKHKIGCHSQYSKYETALENYSVISLYQQEILLTDANLHEFDFNMKIAAFITNQTVTFEEPFLEKKLLPTNQIDLTDYAVIFPGASAGSKRWSPNKFAKLAANLIKDKNLKVVIAGSKNDQKFSKKIIQNLKNNSNVIDYCGQTSLLQLMAVINGAKVLVSNDTSAAHIAACLGVKTLVIVNGNHYGRFLPYPIQSQNMNSIYPTMFNNKLQIQGFEKMFNYHIGYDIQTIKVKTAMIELKKILS